MFTVKASSSDCQARTGILQTAHGKAETPFFMPVATKGTVKYVSGPELEQMGKQGVQSLIANALLLHLKPGSEFLRTQGGLHNFMQFHRTIFTDSGGFQMLIPSLFEKINDKGVSFRNPFTLQKLFVTPEQVMEIEMSIGADVAMTLDHVAPVNSDKKLIEEAYKRTHLWAKRCKEKHDCLKKEIKETSPAPNPQQLLFGIAQGGKDPALRKKSAQYIADLDFDGHALGGLCIGETKKEMTACAQAQLTIFKKEERKTKQEKPVYFMGVGTPLDVLNAVAMGMDCFDSIFPTRKAREGLVFTSSGQQEITKTTYAYDKKALDPACNCYVCTTFSRAYLHHLFKVNEYTVHRYLSYHNLYVMTRLMEEIRTAIKKDRFLEYKKDIEKDWRKR